MNTGPSSYYDGYGSYDCPKNFLPIKPLKVVKKNTSPENSITKKIITGSSLYYNR